MNLLMCLPGIRMVPSHHVGFVLFFQIVFRIVLNNYVGLCTSGKVPHKSVLCTQDMGGFFPKGVPNLFFVINQEP